MRKRGLRRCTLESLRRTAFGDLGFLRRARVHAAGVLVTVDELDHGQGRVVAVAEAGLEDAAVAAVALLVARPEHLEELADHAVVAQLRHGEAAGVKVAALAERDQPLEHGAKVLRLGKRRDDLLVLDQRGRHVREHRQAMLGGAVEPPAAKPVTHGSLLLLTAAVPRNGRCLLANGEWRMANGEWSCLGASFHSPLAISPFALSSAPRSASRDPRCSRAASRARPCRGAGPCRRALP